jgi:hypothetical protein
MFITPEPQKTWVSWESRLRITLIGLLNKFRRRQAELPIDKVFALYGVFKELGIPLEPPDYTKSMAEVYLNFTLDLIKWHNSLDVLIEVSHPGILGMPSWVPDWSKHYHRVFSGKAAAAGKSSPSFSILLGSGSNNRESNNGANHNPRIITKGTIVDKVAFCTTALQMQGENDKEVGASDDISPLFLDNIKALMQWLLDARQPQFHIDHSNEAISDTLFEIMHSETNYDGVRQARLRQNFADWKSYLTTDSSTAISLDSSKLACAQTLMADDPIYRYHLDRCNTIAGKRVFFTTAEGRLGSGPFSMRTGDAVALLAGFKCPLLLRGKGPNYEVVGVAYIDRIMLGEAWPGIEVDIQQLTLV